MIEIEITEDDIKNGEKKSFYNCPIALAVKRTSIGKKHPRPSVGHGYISFYIGEDFYSIRLPQIALNFIRNFDRYENVKPFKFEVDCALYPELSS